MSTLFTLPRQFVIDGAGDPRAGAKLHFYDAGTLTGQDTYSDNDRTTPNTNPVVADASGTFGPIYLANTSYRVILKDADDVQIWDQDDYNAPLLGLFGAGVLVKSGSFNITTDDKGHLIEATTGGTALLPAVIDAEDGFTLAIWESGTGNLLIDPNNTEQINGGSTISIGPNEWAILVCDGSEWKAIQTYTQASDVSISDPDNQINAISVESALLEIAGFKQAINLSTWNASTTYADITSEVDLTADADYAIELTFMLNTDAVPDFKFRLHTSDTLTLDADTQLICTVIDETAGTVQGINVEGALDADYVIDGSAGNQFVTLRGTIRVDSAGAFSIQGAQNTSNASDTTIATGGLFSMWQIPL